MSMNSLVAGISETVGYQWRMMWIKRNMIIFQ